MKCEDNDEIQININEHCNVKKLSNIIIPRRQKSITFSSHAWIPY